MLQEDNIEKPRGNGRDRDKYVYSKPLSIADTEYKKRKRAAVKTEIDTIEAIGILPGFPHKVRAIHTDPQMRYIAPETCFEEVAKYS